MDEFITQLKESLSTIINPRFYEAEMGFQGELISELRSRLPILKWDGSIIEQEYYKKAKKHGIRKRPDIIIHVPYNPKVHESRKEGNFVVIELKLKADVDSALKDYKKLSKMCEILNYPLAIFINIGCEETYLDNYNGKNKDKIIAFSIHLSEGQPILREKRGT